MTIWPYDHMTICCVLCLCLCLFLNKVLLGLRTLCQHGRRQAVPRHIKLRSVCKASWRSDAVLMPRVGAIMEIGHRMWRRQVAQAPITTIVRAVDAILIHGSMAHGELWKTQTDYSEHGFFLIENFAKQLKIRVIRVITSLRSVGLRRISCYSCSKKNYYSCSKFKIAVPRASARRSLKASPSSSLPCSRS